MTLKARAFMAGWFFGTSAVKSTVFCFPMACVRTDGDDGNSGLTWALAKKTIQGAIDGLGSCGGEVWVAEGTYVECLSLGAGVSLYGGFTGVETDRGQRDWKANVTAIDGAQSGSVVTCFGIASNQPTVDGFTITNGYGWGGGIYSESSSLTITNNIITNNMGDYDGGGILSWGGSPVITNNLILGNSANEGMGGGIYSTSSSPIIANNMITGNSARHGGGIWCDGEGTPTIANNTIAENSDYGIVSTYYCSPVLSNNIVAFNSFGIAKGSTGTPALHNNCVYGNTSYDYSPGLSPGTGDISLDPQFLAPWVKDYHLMPSSPCVNAGDDTAVQAGALDLDGKQRILGTHVDMGCFEWDSTPYWIRQISQAKAIPEGNSIQLRGKPITAAFGGAFYVEEPDRSSGMRILSPELVAKGDLVTVVGQPVLDDGERALNATSVSLDSQDDDLVPRPFIMLHRSLGGGDSNLASDRGQQGVYGTGLWNRVGLNNIGLLINTTGRVTFADTEAEEEYFYLDDGSALDDGSGHLGVKTLGIVPVEEGQEPVGKYVKVTGISSCYKVGSDLLRMIRSTEVSVVPE